MLRAALFVRMALSVLVSISGLTSVGSAHALSGAGIEAGYGVESTDNLRVGLRWDWDKYWSVSTQWNASGFWEASLGYLRSDGAGKTNNWDVGLMPVFRLRSGISRFFLEGGVGAHLLSNDYINNSRELGSKLLFGDLLGFGWSFGDKDRYELGYRFLHFSNAYLAEPNEGANLHLLRLGYNY
jgi:lipid A 3-O-deacylase